MNAKEELLRILQDKKVKCACIVQEEDFTTDGTLTQIDLKLNYTEKDWVDFLTKLNFEYDSGFGGQNLYGIVWLDNGSWLERGEYDGSEWWEHKILPEIPKELY
jgi:hypothetical protein